MEPSLNGVLAQTSFASFTRKASSLPSSFFGCSTWTKGTTEVQLHRVSGPWCGCRVIFFIPCILWPGSNIFIRFCATSWQASFPDFSGMKPEKAATLMPQRIRFYFVCCAHISYSSHNFTCFMSCGMWTWLAIPMMYFLVKLCWILNACAFTNYCIQVLI